MTKKKRKSTKRTSASSGRSADDTITVSKVMIWQVATAAFAVLFLISLATGGFGLNFDGQATNQAAPTGNTGQPSGGSGAVDVSLDGANTLGNENADVVLVEYSSMTCPFCGRHHEQTYPRLRENFVDNDQILMVYKHFVRNDVDILAANAAECAGDQGQFFEYVDIVFANQQQINPNNLESWAQELNLDMDEWRSCQQNEEYRSKVLADTQEGQSNGIRGTPGFLLNGELISGAQPYNTFASAIESELGQ